MTMRSAARKYARALIDVAVKEGDPRRVDQELDQLSEVITGHPELRAILAHPAVAPARKRGIVTEILDRTPDVSLMVRKLLLLLADRDALVLVPEIRAAYHEALLDHLQVVRALVVTAVPLADDRRQAVEARLAEATGRQVQVEGRVDPSLIGGVVTRVGSVVYDGSVARQLERLKERLVEPVR
jgi:F-type H+-transporting ATPase subunit delta